MKNNRVNNKCPIQNKFKTLDNSNLESILGSVVSWIANCDSKAAALIGWVSVIISILGVTGVLTSAIDVVLLLVSLDRMFVVFYMLFMLIFFVMFVSGFLLLVIVLMLRLSLGKFRKNGVKNESLIYFASIADNESYEEYFHKLNGYADYKYRRDLIRQIYVCSKICSQKFKRYKIGSTGVVFGGGILAIMLIGANFIINLCFYKF